MPALRLVFRSFRPAPVRGGYTLLELLLVLAVVLTVAGMLVAGAQQFSAQHRLEQAAAEVELFLGQGRLAAVESNKPVLFCYQVSGRGYGIVPFFPEPDSQGGTAVRAGTLPEGFSFGTGVPAGDEPQPQQTAGLSAWHIQQLATAGAAAQGNWQVLVMFLPDGTAQDAVLDVVDDRGRFIRLRLRGLTGTITQEAIQAQSGP